MHWTAFSDGYVVIGKEDTTFLLPGAHWRWGGISAFASQVGGLGSRKDFTPLGIPLVYQFTVDVGFALKKDIE